MSFPHRTAFYDTERDIIVYPDRDEICISQLGELGYIRNNRVFTSGRYIPLASTGLEDSEGNEVFEGHLIRWGNSIYVVCYVDGMNEHKGLSVGFYLTDSNFERWHELKSGSIEMVGHALTDPEMVPDSFDVEGYFGVDV